MQERNDYFCLPEYYIYKDTNKLLIFSQNKQSNPSFKFDLIIFHEEQIYFKTFIELENRLLVRKVLFLL